MAVDVCWLIWPLAAYGALALVSALLSVVYRGWRRNGQRPFISVLILARNKERVIEGLVRGLGAIASVADRCGHEVVVVDDHSEDQTSAILDRLVRHHPALRTVHLAELGSNKGAPAEVGLFMCRSPIVLVLNLQSGVHPRMLLQAAAFLLAPRAGEIVAMAKDSAPPPSSPVPHGRGFQRKERADHTSN